MVAGKAFPEAERFVLRLGLKASQHEVMCISAGTPDTVALCSVVDSSIAILDSNTVGKTDVKANLWGALIESISYERVLQ